MKKGIIIISILLFCNYGITIAQQTSWMNDRGKKTINTRNNKSNLFMDINSYSINYGDGVNKYYWLTAGIGKTYFGLTYGLKFSYAFSANVITLRYLSASELVFNVDGRYNEPKLEMREVALLFGKSIKDDVLVISLHAGIGYINAVDRKTIIFEEKYERINISKVGIALEANIRMELTSNLGLGISCFGNINNTKTYLGGMIEIHFGDFH